MLLNFPKKLTAAAPFDGAVLDLRLVSLLLQMSWLLLLCSADAAALTDAAFPAVLSHCAAAAAFAAAAVLVVIASSC